MASPPPLAVQSRKSLRRFGTGFPRIHPERRYQALQPEFVQSVYLKNKNFYDKIQAKGTIATEAVVATGILISGCQDNQLSADGAFNGLFTGTLKTIWNGGAFKKKGYNALQKAVLKLMPPDQSPNYFTIGRKDTRFDKIRPFTVEA